MSVTSRGRHLRAPEPRTVVPCRGCACGSKGDVPTAPEPACVCLWINPETHLDLTPFLVSSPESYEEPERDTRCRARAELAGLALPRNHETGGSEELRHARFYGRRVKDHSS